MTTVNNLIPLQPLWEASPELAQRLEQKSFDATGSFKVCIVPPGSLDFEPIKKLFLESQPSGLVIQAVHRIENPAATKGFTAMLHTMEAEAKSAFFAPRWRQGKTPAEVEKRTKIFEDWESLAGRFGPLDLADGKPALSSVKVLPLWYGTDLKTLQAITTWGFSVHSEAATRAGCNRETGTFGKGIYFTENAGYAARLGRVLVLTIVGARSPFPLIGSDVTVLKGREHYENYNAHVSSVVLRERHISGSLACTPSYGNEVHDWQELVVFEKTQALARFVLVIAPSNPTVPLQQSYEIAACHTAAEIGEIDRVKNWVNADARRLYDLHSMGETLLYPALSGNHLDLFQWLCLQDPALLHQCREDGRSLQFLAVLGGRKEILKSILEHIPYSAKQFQEEAKEFGYSSEKISNALQSVGWSTWAIPARSQTFTGRAALISAIQEKFAEDPSKALSQVALVGPGGMGKSAVALEYTHANQNRYTRILWVEAEASPLEVLKDLGVTLKVVESATPLEEAGRRVKAYLEAQPGWLLVFDNAESPLKWASHLPKFGGHLLITSRDPNWKNSLRMDPFTSLESLALLAKWTQYPEVEEAKTLAEELGHLPLALTQAGSYMKVTGTSYPDYLSLLLKKKTSLFENHGVPLDYSFGVTTTWQVSIDKIQESAADSLKALYRALYLSPDNILKFLLGSGDSSFIALNKLLRPLIAYSLLTPGSQVETFSIHRLTQETLRELLVPQEKEEALSTLMDQFKRQWQFNHEEPSTWEHRLVPHLEAFCHHATDSLEKANFLNGLGLYFQKVQLNYQKALAYHEKSFAVRKDLCHNDYELLAQSLNNLGNIYFELDQLDEAIDFFEEVVILKKELNPGQPSLALALNNLGLAYLNNEDLETAIEMLLEGLEIFDDYKSNYGEDHPDAVNLLCNLGTASEKAGDFTTAAYCKNRALDISQDEFEENSPNRAKVLNSLAVHCRKLGQQDKALKLLNQSLQIQEKIKGEHHPDFAANLSDLGCIYLEMRQFDKAFENLMSAHEIYIKAFGDARPHSLISISLNNLGEFYQARRDFLKAIDFFKQSLTIDRSIFGEEHFNIQDGCLKIGKAYLALNNAKNAQIFIREAEAVGNSRSGTEQRLGGAYTQAISSYQKSLQILREEFPNGHPLVAINLNGLGVAYAKSRQFVMAISFQNQSVEVLKKDLGERHPRVAQSYLHLGHMYNEQRNPVKARECYSKALSIFKQCEGDFEEDIATAERELALVSSKLKKS